MAERDDPQREAIQDRLVRYGRNYVKTVGGYIASVQAIAAIIGVSLAIGELTKSSPAGNGRSRTPDIVAAPPTGNVTLKSRAERISSTGGVLLGYEISTGVDCKPSSKIKIWQGPNKGKYFLNSTSSYTSDPNMNQLVRDNYENGNVRTIFAGLDSDSAWGLGGYYPLSSGWAVRHTKDTDSYTLFHFDGIKSDGTTPEYTGTEKNGKLQTFNMPLGSIVGQQVVKFTNLDLELGQSFSYQDGQTSVTVDSPGVSSFPPGLQVDVSCYPSLPTVTSTR